MKVEYNDVAKLIKAMTRHKSHEVQTLLLSIADTVVEENNLHFYYLQKRSDLWVWVYLTGANDNIAYTCYHEPNIGQSVKIRLLPVESRFTLVNLTLTIYEHLHGQVLKLG